MTLPILNLSGLLGNTKMGITYEISTPVNAITKQVINRNHFNWCLKSQMTRC